MAHLFYIFKESRTCRTAERGLTLLPEALILNSFPPTILLTVNIPTIKIQKNNLKAVGLFFSFFTNIVKIYSLNQMQMLLECYTEPLAYQLIQLRSPFILKMFCRALGKRFLAKALPSVISSCYKQALTTPIVQAYTRSAKAAKKNEQAEHWHILNTDSIVKDLQIIYNEENQTVQSLTTLKKQSQTKLTIGKYQILNKFQEFRAFFEKNKTEIQKMLSQISLTSEVVLESLQNVAESLRQFCQNESQMSFHELHAKANVLSFIVKQILQERHQQSVFKKLAYILQVEIRLKSTFNYFDIFNSTERNITNSHPSLYPQVWKHIQIETFDDHEKIVKKYKQIEEVLHATGGAIQKAERYKNGFLQKLFLGLHLPMNFLQYQWGLLNSLMFYRTANLESYKKFLNLYEDGFIRLITEHVIFPKIQTNTVIYIPAEGDFDQNLDIFKQNKDHILVRILYHKELPLIKKGKKTDGAELQDIIVHMHGGGFVGLSSHTTQNYTRPWANQLKMPLFSIDYRMPPTHPYPHAPNDCLQVYKFITKHLHRYMRIRPKNIYICGDSAGGNLSCSLTALVMKNNLIKPKGLFLAYPCTDVRMVYYPSRKFLINDPILWPSIAEMFFNSYTNQSQRDDPIASPVLLSEQFIGGPSGDKRFPLNWPLTYITVGSKDMLRDQCFLLMQRMVESNVSCKCFLFEHLCHAFFSTQGLMEQSMQAFKHSIGAFKELVQRSRKEQL